MEQLKTALIVDDDPMMLVIVSAILRNNNYHVVEGNNGADAISKFILTRPSLIVIDMNMPVMDGCSAASIIRDMQYGDRCTIILFTAESKDRIVSSSACQSVNHIINKHNVNELRKLINKQED